MSSRSEALSGMAITPATARGDDRQAQLLEIASRLFARNGFKGTSLRAIAEEAQITKAALYYHFPNKEALYHKIVFESFERLIASVKEAMATAGSAEQQVRAFMLTTARYFQEHRDAWVAGSTSFWHGDEAAYRSQVLSYRDDYEKLLRSAIRVGVESGEFRAVDPAMVGRMLLASVNSMARWHKPRGRLSTTDVVEQFLDIAFGGLRAR